MIETQNHLLVSESVCFWWFLKQKLRVCLAPVRTKVSCFSFSAGWDSHFLFSAYLLCCGSMCCFDGEKRLHIFIWQLWQLAFHFYPIQDLPPNSVVSRFRKSVKKLKCKGTSGLNQYSSSISLCEGITMVQFYTTFENVVELKFN